MAGRLDFEIDTELEPGLVTARAGIPSLVEAYRLTGTAAVVERTVKLKARKRGLSSSEMVESFLALWATGGERAEDFDHFRQDKALAELIGHELPAAQTARDFLDRFHEDGLPLLQEGLASVPSESAPLQGLAAANRELILDLQCRKSVRNRDARYRRDSHPLVEALRQASLRRRARLSAGAGAVGRAGRDRRRRVPRRQRARRHGQPARHSEGSRGAAWKIR